MRFFTYSFDNFMLFSLCFKLKFLHIKYLNFSMKYSVCDEISDEN